MRERTDTELVGAVRGGDRTARRLVALVLARVKALYQQGHGFVGRGFGHVHRAIAGPGGAHFYVTYVLPSGSSNHIILADQPRACS